MSTRRALASLLAAGVALAGCRTTVRSGLGEAEANQIVVALDRAAIGAAKASEPGGRGRYRVEVDSADATRALSVLESARLPKRAEPGFDELYQPSALLPTPQDERARWAAALAGELSRSLERMRGVREARVHLAVADAEQPLDAPVPPPKASVLLQRARGMPALPEQPVRALVAGAVDGLAPERVTVVQVEAEPAAETAGARLVQIGPIAVSRGSMAAFKGLVAAALALNLLLALALVALLRRARAARRQPPQDASASG